MELSFTQLPEKKLINKAVTALQNNGMEAIIARDSTEAKKMALEIIPENAQVMTMTSMTLETIGLSQELNESDRYDSVRKIIKEKGYLGSVPDWAVGSVHAITENGQVLIASKTGSQLPAYAYGANHVLWVVGTQKIVADLDMAFKRIYEHSLPLEDARAHKAYGVGSEVAKILIINHEIKPGRIKIILVEELLGF
ncbi:lactate utilization protein [Patescibacteria group bacterium]|nr:lactate utilization protein [Patescibacteria group bacterium]